MGLALFHLHLAMGRQIRPYRIFRGRSETDGDSRGTIIRRFRHFLHYEHLHLTHNLAHEMV